MKKLVLEWGRHYQKRRDGKPYIDGCRILLANAKELLSNSPTAFDVEKVIEELENLREAELRRPDMCGELGDADVPYNDGVSQGRYEE